MVLGDFSSGWIEINGQNIIIENDESKIDGDQNWYFSMKFVLSKFKKFLVQGFIGVGSGGQILELRNVERPIFRNFKIANIKITKNELFDSFIYEFNFSNCEILIFQMVELICFLFSNCWILQNCWLQQTSQLLYCKLIIREIEKNFKLEIFEILEIVKFNAFFSFFSVKFWKFINFSNWTISNNSSFFKSGN